MGSGRLKIRARLATEQDCDLLHAWANDPVTRAMSFSSAEIPIEAHRRWLFSKLADPACHFVILLSPNEVPMGQARFDTDERDEALISFSLAHEARGRGYAAPAIRGAVRSLRETKGASSVIAEIRPENTASLRAFEAAGFGAHRILSRNDHRVIQLSASVDSGVGGRIRSASSAAWTRGRARYASEVLGERPVGRARAVIELTKQRRALRGARPEHRVAVYRQVVAQHPEYFRAHSFLGHALLSLGDARAASASFERALALAPSDLGSARGLSACAALLGETLPREVIAALRRDVEAPYREQLRLLAQACDARSKREAEQLAHQIARLHPDGAKTKPSSLLTARARGLELLEAYPLQLPLRWAVDSLRRARKAEDSPPAAPTLGPSKTPRIAQMDVISILNQIETALPVHEWTVNGLAVWPVLRNQIGAHLLSLTQDLAPPPAQGPDRPGVRPGAAPLSWTDLERHRSHLAALGRKDALFLSLTSHRGVMNGTSYDRWFDPIRDALDRRHLSSLQLAAGPNAYLGEAPERRPVLSVKPFLAEMLSSAPRFLLWDLSLEGWESLGAILSPYAAALGEVPWLDANPTRWASRLGALFHTIEYFDFVLSRVRPKLVFVTVYYSLNGFALCLAGARRGIPVIDVQHGMTTRHYAYEAWSRVPAIGYPTMPSVFWSWTERDAARISDWSSTCARHHRSLVGGHPWSGWLEAHPSELDSVRARVERMPKTRLIVLLTLNWSMGFAEVFKEIVAASGAHITWWIRLHPIMRAECADVMAWCRDRARAPCSIEEATDLPLDLLLRAADVHLTLSSSVTQEATRAGLPTVCLEPRSEWLYAEEIASGWVQFVDGDPAEVVRALEAQVERSKRLERWDPFPPHARIDAALAELLDAPHGIS